MGKPPKPRGPRGSSPGALILTQGKALQWGPSVAAGEEDQGDGDQSGPGRPLTRGSPGKQ